MKFINNIHNKLETTKQVYNYLHKFSPCLSKLIFLMLLLMVVYIMFSLIMIIFKYEIYPWNLPFYIQNKFNYWIRYVFRHGPHLQIMGIDVGFWHGMSKSEICSSIAGQTDSFWEKNIIECYELYKDREDSFVVLIILIFIMQLIWFLIKPIFY